MENLPTVAFRFLLRPSRLFADRKLSKYTTLDGWYESNMAKVDIYALAIGCKCTHDLKEQEKEFYEYRKSVCTTLEEWSRLGDELEYT